MSALTGKARIKALRHARACPICRDVEGEQHHPPAPCIQCGKPIAYYSCTPGYCRICSHDPGWVSLAELDGGRS